MQWIRRYGLLGLLSVLLALSLAANIVFFQRGKDYYKDLSETRLDPLGLRYYPPAMSQQPIETGKMTIVFFGDSRAQQWPTPTSDERWTFINRGIGAQTSVQVMQRFNSHVAPLKPNVVLIQVGINDLKTIPILPDRKDEIIAQCKADIRFTVEQARATGATVLLTTIFPTGAIPVWRQPFWSPDVDQAVVSVNNDIRSLAASDVIIFDTYALLEHDGYTPSQYAADELHLKPEGYALLNQHLTELLRTRVTP